MERLLQRTNRLRNNRSLTVAALCERIAPNTAVRGIVYKTVLASKMIPLRGRLQHHRQPHQLQGAALLFPPASSEPERRKSTGGHKNRFNPSVSSDTTGK